MRIGRPCKGKDKPTRRILVRGGGSMSIGRINRLIVRGLMGVKDFEIFISGVKGPPRGTEGIRRTSPLRGGGGGGGGGGAKGKTKIDFGKRDDGPSSISQQREGYKVGSHFASRLSASSQGEKIAKRLALRKNMPAAGIVSVGQGET